MGSYIRHFGHKTSVLSLLEQYSCISAHVLQDDRLSGKYHMVDDDTKLGMALSMQLQITPNMQISRIGINHFLWVVHVYHFHFFDLC